MKTTEVIQKRLNNLENSLLLLMEQFGTNGEYELSPKKYDSLSLIVYRLVDDILDMKDILDALDEGIEKAKD